MTPRMSPPTSFDRLTDDRLRQPGDGAFCGYEDHPLLADKCHCLIGGHAHSRRVTLGANQSLESRHCPASRSSVEEAREECRQRGSPLRQQLRPDIDVAAVNVAPAPGLAAFEGRNQRMTGRIEVLQSMRVLRILAASDVTAGQTNAKLVPLHSEREAFLTAVRCWRYAPNLVYMFATLDHCIRAQPRRFRDERDVSDGRRHRVFCR